MLIFKIFSWGACSRTPLESFLALKFFKINSAGKIRLKKVTKIDAPSLKKILNRKKKKKSLNVVVEV